MADKVSRNWTFVAYPDSAPEDWMQQLDKRHLQFAVSPLHDADLNGDETEKKPHWHVFMTWDGNKSYSQVRAISESVNATIPQVAENPVGLLRYFIHLDNPEKHQYNKEDIKAFGGIDIEKPFQISKFMQMKMMVEIVKFCKIKKITYFCDLIDVLIAEERNEWLYIALCTNTIGINSYLKGSADKIRDVNRWGEYDQ